ncbi:hypothetical protein HDU81_010094 [Chytriomyces hyalinus]|nr:hypothetical protein HDU81_010094 [Chytriomyces hyalinus]
MLGEGSKIIFAKWQNLTDEQRAIYEAKANEANANPFQLVSELDSGKKVQLSKKALSQLKKCFEVLDALGWSVMFAGINEDTAATFKQIIGEPAQLAAEQYKKAGKDLVSQLQVGRRAAKMLVSIAMPVTNNNNKKSTYQDRVENLALDSLNASLVEKGLKLFPAFPWRQLFGQPFHFVNWPANIPLKRGITIEQCKTLIQMFACGDIHASIGVDQQESTETSDTSLDIEIGQLLEAEADFEDTDFLELAN